MQVTWTKPKANDKNGMIIWRTTLEGSTGRRWNLRDTNARGIGILRLDSFVFSTNNAAPLPLFLGHPTVFLLFIPPFHNTLPMLNKAYPSQHPTFPTTSPTSMLVEGHWEREGGDFVQETKGLLIALSTVSVTILLFLLYQMRTQRQ